jgi:predicted nucleic acid-binding protein
MDRVALDTTFLIDLQNERRGRGPVQGATAFLESHLETIFFLPVVALGEYLEGFSDVACPEAWALVDPLNLLDVTEDVARIYAATVRHLRAVGLLRTQLGCRTNYESQDAMCWGGRKSISLPSPHYLET